MENENQIVPNDDFEVYSDMQSHSDLENKSNLQDELVKLSMDFEVKSLSKHTNFWSNINIVHKYPKLFTEVNDI